MLDFLDNLPIATPVGRVERGPGVLVDGAHTDAAMVSRLFGDNVPVTSFEIGVRGRGSLIVDAATFDQLLTTMIMVRAMADMPNEEAAA